MGRASSRFNVIGSPVSSRNNRRVPSSIRCAAPRRVFGDQLALAVPGAQLDGPVGFRRCAIGDIGMVLIFVLEMLQRLLGLFQDVFPPVEQLLAEIFTLAVIHERFSVAGPICLLVSVAVQRIDLTVLLWRIGTTVLALEHLKQLHLRLLPPHAYEVTLARRLISKLRDRDNNDHEGLGNPDFGPDLSRLR